jgi:hypothetical protein
MAIVPTAQDIICWNDAFVVSLVTNLPFESATMRVLVDGEPRKFQLMPTQAAELEQLVDVLGASAVSVQKGWGKKEDAGRVLVIEVGTEKSTGTEILSVQDGVPRPTAWLRIGPLRGVTRRRSVHSPPTSERFRADLPPRPRDWQSRRQPFAAARRP